MPKDNEVDEKVVAFAMTDDQGDAPMTIATTDRKYAESWASEGIRVDPLYSAATVAELRAEVERLEALLAEGGRRLIDENMRANAAERRVGELEEFIREWRDDSLLRSAESRASFRLEARALTGADPT